jgi:hypothetical protein
VRFTTHNVPGSDSSDIGAFEADGFVSLSSGKPVNSR